jgi:peptidoglycan hydrolase-like protein with peptidoglycan-binding domain
VRSLIGTIVGLGLIGVVVPAGATMPAPAGLLGIEAPSVMLTLVASQVVRDIQRELLSQGYDPGPLDGAIGPNTRGAIRQYQSDVGLPIDGQATDALLLDLRTRPATEDPQRRVVSRAVIQAVQQDLAQRGYNPGPTDGTYRPALRLAIQAYQAAAGLPQDGIASNALLQHIRFSVPSG